MTTLIAQHEEIFGEARYIAVPSHPKLQEILALSELNSKSFPYCGGPTEIESYKAIIEHEGAIIDLTATFSKKPFFDPKIYNLPRIGLDGYTTLHISAIGTGRRPVQDIVQVALSLFKDVKDLDMRTEVQSLIGNRLNQILLDFAPQRDFFNEYVGTRDRMSNIAELPHKRLQKGVFITLAQQTLNFPSFPEKWEVRHINRISGSYSGIPVELSLIYLTGEGVIPAIYGMLLSRAHEEGCPTWEQNLCDNAQLYAGYIFNPANLVLGACSLRPELNKDIYRDQESGRVAHLEFCLRNFVAVPADSPWENVLKELRVVDRTVNLAPEKVEELKLITKLVYNSSTR
jgi:hypothetical protein